MSGNKKESKKTEIELPGGGKVEMSEKQEKPIRKARKRPTRKPEEEKPEPVKEPEKKEEAKKDDEWWPFC